MTTPPTNPPTDQSNLVFVPWVRSGAAAAIDVIDTLAAQMGVANITANLTVNGQTNVPPLTVRLRGPADIIGIDAHQIIRTDPAPGSTDFESSNFACVEFDRPDYPWLFTPAAANTAGKLRPWLCLVVVQKQAGVTIGSTPDAPLPLLTIASPAKPSLELPNLTDSWAWAHAQAAPNSPAGPVVASDVRDALDNDPARSLSRLICPRVLVANTDYIACVVPTFSLSAKTGQGTAVVDAELGKTSLTPAWTLTASLASVTVPVYYHWEFRTGPEGDFATLAAKLRARPAPDRLGRTTIDISNPGFAPNAGFPAGASIDMEGALRAIVPAGAPDLMPPWPVNAQSPFQVKLAQILNTPAVIAATNPTADPVLGPVLYGRWLVSALALSQTGSRWYDQINLDPRLRVVAALGTKVVQDNQEALMASAWEQAGEVRAANQRLRQLQMSMAVGTKLMTKHFSKLTQEHSARVGAPLFGQIASVSGSQSFATVAGQLPAASVPMKAVSPAMRRIGRLRGPVTRRISSQGGSRPKVTPWVDALNTGVAALPPVPASDLVTITGLNSRSGTAVIAFPSMTSALVAGRADMPFFVTHPDGGPIVTALSESVAPLPFDSFQATVFRKAAADHLARVKPERGSDSSQFHVPPPPPPTMTDVQGALTAGTQPTQTVTAVAHTVITRNREGNVIQPFLTAGSGGDDSTSLDPVMAAPAFPHAMSESLRDLSQDLILPGIDAVPADTVLGLETNRRFVEAYMLGLNVEMGRELLWRGYPTDQRGTYFANFWSDARADIQPVSAWGTNALGAPALAPNADERFVMLLRSSLLKRYPDALIYLTRAVAAPTGRKPSELVADERQPIFSGSMDPDVAFFGFDVSTDDAVGSSASPLGYYVVIQEHPTAPRFGLQSGAKLAAGTTHVPIGQSAPMGQSTLDLTWGLNSATTAAIVRHRPTRLAIHASQFLAASAPVTSPAPGAIASPPVTSPPDSSPPVSSPPGPITSPPPPQTSPA